MTTNTEEQKETKPLKHKPKTEESQPIKNPNTTPRVKKNTSFITKFTFIAAIAAIIIAAYTLVQNQKLQKFLNKDNPLSTQFDELKENQTKIKTLILEEVAKGQQNQNELRAQINQFSKQSHSAPIQHPNQNENWKLFKARYYLELAQINVHWSTGFDTSIALLQQADDLLKQLNETEVLEIRQIIAKEIAQLRAQPTIDSSGLLSQLDAAQISINNLNVKSFIKENKLVTENKTPGTSDSSPWHSRWLESLSLMKKLVIIRHNDEEINPLLSPLYESILRESVRLNLQEAQWALLNNNSDLYQSELKQAITNLKRTFNNSDQGTVTLLKQLNELQTINLNQKKPDIGLGLPLLNQLIDKNTHSQQQDVGAVKGSESLPVDNKSQGDKK